MATSNTMMMTHRSKKIKGESKTYHEKTLISTLRNFQRTSNLTDFTIICRDQEKIQSHKLLLATRSKHFENLFTHEPETNTIFLDYQVRIVKILSVYFVYLQLFQQDQSIIMLEIGFTVSLSEKQQFCKFVSFIQNVKS